MSTTIQPDTAEITVLMSEDEANEITLKIKQYVGMVCVLVKEAHEKQAWRALGYPTWTAYCKTEFNVGKSRSYQLVKYAEVIALGTDTTGLPESTIVDSLPEATARGIDRDELADLLDEAYSNLPADAPISTRRELFDALIAQITEPSAPEDEEPAPASPSVPAPNSDGATPPAPSEDPDSDGDTPSSPSESDLTVDQTNDPHMGVGGDGGTEGTGQPAAHAHGAGADGEDGPAPVLPAPLPDDWRDRLARSLHLLGCSAELLGAALTEDDVIELTDLAVHIEAVLNAHQEQA